MSDHSRTIKRLLYTSFLKFYIKIKEIKKDTTTSIHIFIRVHLKLNYI